MHGPKVVDVFSGAGGFSLGAALAGFSVPLMIDVDPDLTASHRKNFPQSRLLLADVSRLDPVRTLKGAGLEPDQVVGLIGGPPCQGFSHIGARDPQDPRNHLVTHFFRFVASILPNFFIMENVPGILDREVRTVLDAGVRSISRRYHVLGPIPIDAADFGAATVRKRVLVIGIRADVAEPLPQDCITHSIRTRASTVRDAIADLPPMAAAEQDDLGEYWAAYERNSADSRPYAKAARAHPPNGLACPEVRAAHRKFRISGFKPTAHSKSVLKRFHAVDPGRRDPVSRCPRLAWDLSCPTIRAGTGKDRGSFQSIRPIHPEGDRVINIREAARLQGFPDWFQFHPTNWHSFRMIGNSVSPYVSRAVLCLVRDHLKSNDRTHAHLS